MSQLPLVQQQKNKEYKKATTKSVPCVPSTVP
jgi:hypothetical protein